MMRKRLALAAMMIAAVAAWPAISQRPVPVAPALPQPAPTAPLEQASTAPQLTATDVAAWLDGFVPTTIRQGKIAGAQIVVVKDGQVLVKKGYGYDDVATRRPMDPDRTLVRIGSTSKLFTWTAVMQLVEQGKIDLNADVNRYLDFRIAPRAGRAVTMNDLMRHRGGFEEGLKDVLESDPKRLQTNEVYLKEHARPRLFPAGAVPAYSNYGTSLAGYIVQRVSGEPFDTYVERHILAPLHMARTTFRQPLPAGLAGDVSKGYRVDNGPPDPFELVTTAPAGSVSATGVDMANFMIAHLQDGRFGAAQILRPETARLMHTPAVPPQPGFDTLAHGFFHGHRNGQLVIGHGGDTVVFHTDMNLLPDSGVGIFVNFNSRGENDAVYGARERLFDLFMDRYFPAAQAKDPPAIASAAGDAQAVAGRYESSRRIESGFLGLFYLLQQDVVTANPDGTISLASIEDRKFREIAPGLWREQGGARQLQVTTIDGRRTIVNSDNPTAVIQAVPFARNALLNQTVAGLSLLILLATLLAWPVRAWLRRSYKLPKTVTGRAALVQTLARAAAAADIVYLLGWYSTLAPILQNQLDVYNSGLDRWVRTMQIAAILPLAGAAIGVWNVWLTFRAGRSWGAKLRAVLLAAALVGILWFAWMGSLISFNLNY
ncbi:beta-lactamase family protein [Sphingomonas sp. So64.6b]|uniref:serine hydrolase domain-containing protein n=1 Tax=Sphingomonas sp. So64.6b TaxID=2997354 RepID=UPI001603FE19|nr:serine hydrolase domain-containing protein [Sphingomonas sp. So64.6b]QNA86446.1 beta-lactamase family protein [Sphingomonas sp. So64.6b]